MAENTPAAGGPPHRPRRVRRDLGAAASQGPQQSKRPPKESRKQPPEVSRKHTRKQQGAGRRRRIALWAAGGAAVLVIAALVVAGLYVRQLQTDFDDNRNVLQMHMGDETVDRTNDDVINMLLLGSDSRGAGLDLADVKGEDGERSDTMMFVHIPADRSGVYVMSIVRDLWVDVPGEGQGRINSALDAGGYELVVDTVEEVLDTHIDHVALIDFNGFEDLTTALGGVYVDNPISFSAGQVNPSIYPQGTIRLQGDDALRYVRERKSFTDGDFMRVQNQQRVVEAIINRFLSAETLTNPQRVSAAVNGIVPYLWMDEALDATTVGEYALQLRAIRSEDIHMFTIPTGEPTVTSGGAQVILKDEETLELLNRSLRHENLDGFLSYMETRDDEDPFEDMTEVAPGDIVEDADEADQPTEVPQP